MSEHKQPNTTTWLIRGVAGEIACDRDWISEDASEESLVFSGSDSFYFVDGKLIMHTKAEYGYAQ